MTTLSPPAPAKRQPSIFWRRFRRSTPGKVGEALRLWLLERCHGYRYERTAPLLIGDRLGDAVAITLLCLRGLSAFGAIYGAGTLVAAGALLVALLMLLLAVASARLAWARRSRA